MSAPKAISASVRRESSHGSTGSRLAGVLCVVVGVVGFYFTGVRPALLLVAAREWSEKECRVLSSEVRSQSDSDGTTYRAHIVYVYEVEGRKYHSDRRHFTSISSSRFDTEAAVVARSPRGSIVPCFVDPAAPSEAVLDREFRAAYLPGILPLSFTVFGILWLLASFRPRLELGSRPASAIDVMADVVVLRSQGTPRYKFAVVVLTAVFWNGLLSLFVLDVVESFLRGRPAWGLTLFLSPFVVVGLVLLLSAVHQFLALFNPRVHITLRTAPARLGSSERIAWRVTGNAGRLSRLTLTCEGREEATYSRGTDEMTDKSVFVRIVVADVSRGGPMHRGESDLAIPATLVPTFNAPHNKIVWSLKVRGEVPRWTDVREEFELTVLPAGGGE